MFGSSLANFGSSFIASAASNKFLKTIRNINGENVHNHATISRCRGHTLIVDQPKEIGGNDLGFTPLECVLSALIGCQVITAQKIAKEWKLPIQAFHFPTVEGAIDVRGSDGRKDESGKDVSAKFQKITLRCEVVPKKGEKVSAQQIEKLRAETNKRCPVSATLFAAGCQFDEKWEVKKQ